MNSIREKRSLEIKILRKKSKWYYLEPSYVAIILGIFTLLTGWLSGWFDSQKISLEEEKLKLKSEISYLHQDVDSIKTVLSRFEKSDLYSDSLLNEMIHIVNIVTDKDCLTTIEKKDFIKSIDHIQKLRKLIERK